MVLVYRGRFDNAHEFALAHNDHWLVLRGWVERHAIPRLIGIVHEPLATELQEPSMADVVYAIELDIIP